MKFYRTPTCMTNLLMMPSISNTQIDMVQKIALDLRCKTKTIHTIKSVCPLRGKRCKCQEILRCEGMP